MSKSYDKLCTLSKEIRILQGVLSLTEWDQETYMPSGGAGHKAEQVETLASIIHKKKTSSSYRKELSNLIDLKTGKVKEASLDPRQKAALREWRRSYLKENQLPTNFVRTYAKLCSEAIQAWKQAKEQSNFKIFQPYLEKIVVLNRKKADLLGYEDHPYDALLDEYEPDTKYSTLRKLFEEIKKPLISLLKKIKAAPQIDDKCIHGDFSIESQLKLTEELLNAVGFTKEHGRLDISAHPFSSSSHPSDNRITTRLDSSCVTSNLLTVLHELGHALYEAGLPEKDYGTPLCQPISLGVHESQSRWWETRIGQSIPFWQFFLPQVKKYFPKLDSVPLDAFVRAINKVSPTFIRVEADEVTYPLHVLLRFDVEHQLIDGSLKVEEIPQYWNSKMEEFLGITPPNDALGCLQDIHWAHGSFGYFPTYALGNIFAAHLFETFEKEYPQWGKWIAKGEFLFMKDWLRENIHKYGKQYSSHELLKKVTGKPLTPKAYLDYLNKKYTSLYKLKKAIIL